GRRPRGPPPGAGGGGCSSALGPPPAASGSPMNRLVSRPSPTVAIETWFHKVSARRRKRRGHHPAAPPVGSAADISTAWRNPTATVPPALPGEAFGSVLLLQIGPVARAIK